MNNNYLDGISKLLKQIEDITKALAPNKDKITYMVSSTQKLLDTITPTMNELIIQLKNIDINKIVAPLKNFSIDLEKAKENPESLYNYMKYLEYLKEYYWTMPYQINHQELKDILDNVKNEKEFDKKMDKYFSKQKAELLFKDLENKIKRNRIIILRQIEASFYSKEYALINNSIISIIDDELSKYAKNKRDTSRKDLLEPILEDLDQKGENIFNIIYLKMLNNNINKLFENIYFDSIQIDTNKRIRRHTSQHGKAFSNKRIDSLMLLNTLYGILYIEELLKKYKNSLIYKNNKYQLDIF